MCALAALFAAGCLDSGGAVSVRWRIAEQQTGKLYDPRDVSDSNGVCCQPDGDQPKCSGTPAWRVNRVRVVLADSITGAVVSTGKSGLDASCSARELTTPFVLDEGLYAITLQAFDPAAPTDMSVEAESPSPQIRTVRKAEIVNLDVVELSVSTL